MTRAKGFFAVSITSLAVGCFSPSGRQTLEELRENRGTPFAVTRFVRRSEGVGVEGVGVEGVGAENADEPRPLAELRRSIEYWNQDDGTGRRNSGGVLALDPPDLHDRLLASIDGGAESVTLIAYRYDALGFDDITLVDYFADDGRLIGSDYLPYLPPERSVDDVNRPMFVGYEQLAWWEMALFPLDAAVYLVVGAKELAAEMVKSPLSALGSGVVGPMAESRGVSFGRAAAAVGEDWANGWSAFTWRFRVRHAHSPIDLARDLLGAVPLVGALFDDGAPPVYEAPDASRDERFDGDSAPSLVAISNGIHAGGDDEQFDAALLGAVRRAQPGVRVVSTPYRYGSSFDVLFSLLGISHGFAYDQAEELVFRQGVRAGETIDLVGFSGGVQRSLVATRLLRDVGVTVGRFTGVAGPFAGPSCAGRSKVLLGESSDDIVVFTAHLANAVLFFVPRGAQIESVPGAGGHHLPLVPNGVTRAPEAGYRNRLEAALGAR